MDSIKNNLSPLRFKLSLLKPKSKTKKKSISSNYSDSSLDNSILNYCTKASKSFDDELIHEKEDNLETLISKTKKVKSKSKGGDKKNVDIYKFDDGDDQGKLFKTRKISENFIEPEAKNNDHVISKPTNEHNSQTFKKPSEKHRRKLYSESIFSENDLKEDNDMGKSIISEYKGYNTEQIHSILKKQKQRKTIESEIPENVEPIGFVHEKSKKQTKLLSDCLLHTTAIERDLRETKRSQLIIKQSKKRQRSESDSSREVSPKKVFKVPLNNFESNAAKSKTFEKFHENSRLVNDSDQETDKQQRKRKRKIKSKAIIDDTTENDTDSSRATGIDKINLNKESFRLVAEQSKQKESRPNKTPSPKKGGNNSETKSKFVSKVNIDHSLLNNIDLSRTFDTDEINRENTESFPLNIEEPITGELGNDKNFSKSTAVDDLQHNKTESTQQVVEQPKKRVRRQTLDSRKTLTDEKELKKSESTPKTISKHTDLSKAVVIDEDNTKCSKVIVEQPKKRERRQTLDSRKALIYEKYANNSESSPKTLSNDLSTSIVKDDMHQLEPKKRTRRQTLDSRKSLNNETDRNNLEASLENISNYRNSLKGNHVDDTYRNTENAQLVVEKPTKRGRRSTLDSKKALVIEKDLNNSELTAKIISNHVDLASSIVVDNKEQDNIEISPKKRGRRPTLDSRKALMLKNFENNSETSLKVVSNDTNSLEGNVEDNIRQDNTESSLMVLEQPKKRGRRPTLDSKKSLTHKKVESNSELSHKIVSSDTNSLEGSVGDDIRQDNTDRSQLIVEQPKKRGRRSTLDSRKTLTAKNIKSDSEISSKIVSNDANLLEESAGNVIRQDNTDSSQLVVEQPKKRGRRSTLDSRKSLTAKMFVNNSETSLKLISNDTNSLKGNDKDDIVSEQPKKRGRRQTLGNKMDLAKATGVEDEQQENTESSQLVPNQPKKRKTKSIGNDLETIDLEELNIQLRSCSISPKSFTSENRDEDIINESNTMQDQSFFGETEKSETIMENNSNMSKSIHENDKPDSEKQPKKRGRPKLDASLKKTPKKVIKKAVLTNVQQSKSRQSKTIAKTKLDSSNTTSLNKSKTQNDIDELDMSDENEDDASDDNLLKPLTKSPKPKTIKINIAKNLKKRPLAPNGKITKEGIKTTSFKRIPEDRFNVALEMLKNENHPVWKDPNMSSCHVGIHRYWEPRNCLMSDANLQIDYARQLLLRRDWVNLSKVLCLTTDSSTQMCAKNYYPLLTKYATLCLAHTDKEQFNKFLQFLIGMDDGNAVLKRCTDIMSETQD